MRQVPDAHAWFSRARLGVFIHWGLYSVHGRDVWSMYNEQTPLSEYALLADEFTAPNYDPDQWARLVAEAGAGYMVVCTRQHDGFSLFDSGVSDFTSAKTGAQRDLVAEYVAAARNAGLRVGFYYSLLDWRYPAYFNGPGADQGAWDDYLQYVHAQIKELCTKYGEVDILWYDGWWPYGAQEWRSEELNAAVRSWQPNIMINDRSGLPGDFDTPEQHIPLAPYERMWEACMTMNNHWGYCPGDKQWKTTDAIIRTLVTCASGDGNFLLNVGPDGTGEFPPEAVRRLRELGGWLARHGEAVYGTDDITALRHRIGEWTFTRVGMVHTTPTSKDRTLYIHVYNWPGSELVVGNLSSRVVSARIVGEDTAVAFAQDGPRVRLTGLPRYAPDPYDTVIALECDEVPSSVSRYPAGA
jgi:alpha-L-fucosidase